MTFIFDSKNKSDSQNHFCNSFVCILRKLHQPFKANSMLKELCNIVKLQINKLLVAYHVNGHSLNLNKKVVKEDLGNLSVHPCEICQSFVPRRLS